MINFLRFFVRKNKSFSCVFNSNSYFHSTNASNFTASSIAINKYLSEMNFSLDQINGRIMQNIENKNFDEFWNIERSTQFNIFFEEISQFNKKLLEEMTFYDPTEKNKMFSIFFSDIKKEEIFKIVFNRFLTLIHSFKKQKQIDYDTKIKILSLTMNFLSILIYFNQNFTQKYIDFFSNVIKEFSDSLKFDFSEKNKKIHSILKENLLAFLQDNFLVYKQQKYNFLSHCSNDFGRLIFNMNEYIFDFDDKIKLSKILLSYLKENLIETGEIIYFKTSNDERNTEIFNLCLKDKSNVIFENVKKIENDDKKIQLSAYFVLSLKQISENVVYQINERKPITNQADLLTCLEVLRIHGQEINLRNVLFYMQKFCDENENNEKKNPKKINHQLKFLVDLLFQISSHLTKTSERTTQIINFFEDSFNLVLSVLENPCFDPKISKDSLSKIYEIFLESHVISLDLLSKLEEKILNFIQDLTFFQFFKIILFYTQSPYGIEISQLKYPFLHYIKTNIDFFNIDALLSIGLAVIQSGYNKRTGLFEIYSFIDNEIWGKMVNRIMNHPTTNLTKPQIFKVFMFAKLINFDPILKNEAFDKIAENYEKEFLAFEVRKISEMQLKFEKMLVSKQMTYIMEPPLIDGIFSVDFLIKYKIDKKIIVEINGPHHYFTIVWKGNQDFLQKVIDSFENRAEIFNRNKMALVESRYASLKQDLLENLGFVVLNISFLDMRNYDSKEKLFNYLMDYLELRNKKKIKGSYFLNKQS